VLRLFLPLVGVPANQLYHVIRHRSHPWSGNTFMPLACVKNTVLPQNISIGMPKKRNKNGDDRVKMPLQEKQSNLSPKDKLTDGTQANA
jgi:hypothetical protein